MEQEKIQGGAKTSWGGAKNNLMEIFLRRLMTDKMYMLM